MAKHLGTLSGKGELFDGDQSLGEFQYQIEILESGGQKGGVVMLKDFGLSAIELSGRRLTLQLQDGTAVALGAGTSTGSDMLLRTTGPIPGF